MRAVSVLAMVFGVVSATALDPLGNTTYIAGDDGDQFMFYYFAASQQTRGGGSIRGSAGSAASSPPVVLWLQGGPGCAATMGLFSENGPVKMDETGQQSARNTSWNLHGMELLTVDSPVGTGYSYNTNGTLQATVDGAMKSLLTALKTALTEWQPQLQGRKLYIMGESFAGRWVPTLAATILRDEASAGATLNLAGIATGSGWTAPVDQAQCIPDFAFNAGMLGPTQRDGYAELVAKMTSDAAKGDWDDAGDAWNNVTSGMFMDAGMPDPSDFRSYGFGTFAIFEAVTSFMNTTEVRAQLKVPDDVTFGGGGGICSSNVSDALSSDLLTSSASDFSAVLGKGIPVSLHWLSERPWWSWSVCLARLPLSALTRLRFSMFCCWIEL